MPYFKFDNNNVYFRIEGAGIPIILLHGNTASSNMFARVESMYADYFKVITIDFPGHGKSDRLETLNTDFWYYNALVAKALLDKLNLDKVIVVGTSGGALVAINLALEYPERVACLFADSFEGDFPLSSYVETLVEDRNRDKMNPDAQWFWRECHGDDWETVVNLDTDVNIAFAKTGKLFFHKSIAELTVPTLLTGSKQDEFCDHLDELYANLKLKNDRLKVHLFEEGGHPAMLSNAEAFFRLVNENKQY